MPEHDEDAWEAAQHYEETKRLRAEIDRLRAQVTELQTDNTRHMLERRDDNVQFQVHQFHTKMGIPILPAPAVPDTVRVKLRLALRAEEFMEELSACFRFNPALRDAIFDEIRYATIAVDLPGLVKEWADSNYINAGNALEFGVDMRPIQRAVHASNMTKIPGNLRGDGKVLKGPEYVPPNIPDLLRAQGWRG